MTFLDMDVCSPKNAEIAQILFIFLEEGIFLYISFILL